MRIKELRLELGLTQAEVAKAIGTSQRNIGRWENGENAPAAIYIKATHARRSSIQQPNNNICRRKSQRKFIFFAQI